jgi:Putative transposase
MRVLRKSPFVVYAKPPFGGPERVLAYLARYTHRTAIANSRLAAVDNAGVAFSYKDYRRGGRARTMRLTGHEFIRRFLLHGLPDGFHRIRHYGFLAKGERGFNLARVRTLIERQTGHEPAEDEKTEADGEPGSETRRESSAACPDCGGLMRRIAIGPAGSAFQCDTS